MSFAALREYFQSRIAEIDTSFKEHASGENIPNNTIDQAYQIRIGPLTSNAVNHTVTDDTIQVEVRLYFARAKDEGVSDRAMDIGNAIRLNAMSPKKMALAHSIRRVFCNSIEPAPRDTNETTLAIVMDFTIRVAYVTG